jgi:methanogenic corrinoid protein MtbC1
LAATSFDKRVFAASGERMEALQACLPRPTLDALAQEVLQRVAGAGSHRARFWVAPEPGEIDELARALVGADETCAVDLILSRYRDGLALDRLYIAYLAAAARRLGDWCATGRISTGDVIRGTGRIYAILQAIRHIRSPEPLAHAPSLVFASVPNEAHVLGVRMAADLFRADGWDVTLLVNLSHDTLIERLAETPCMALGLSASSTERLGDLLRLVLALRISHPALPILVSGRIVQIDEDLVDLVEPDAVVADVSDGRRAVARLVRGGAAAAST